VVVTRWIVDPEDVVIAQATYHIGDVGGRGVWNQTATGAD
jgi:hypothetical protein